MPGQTMQTLLNPVFQDTGMHVQEAGIPWTEALTRKLVGNVQLAAPTISCALILGVGPPALDGVHDSIPHVSWQAFAMSQARAAGV